MKLLPAETSASLINTVHHSDLFDLCERVYRAGLRVDMILADLPYGITQADWDSIIPLEFMWQVFKRILKPKGAIVLTASQPFTSALVCSNLKMFRYEWIWNKVSPVGFLNVKSRPMQQHESILIFGNAAPDYYPQFRKEVTIPFGDVSAKRRATGYGESGSDINYGVGYPLSIIEYPRPNNLSGGGLHPNQKPVELFQYLIRTYTMPDQLVFDPCMGSGTTAYAARAEGRRYIVGDSSAEYVAVAQKRLDAPYTPMFEALLTA